MTLTTTTRRYPAVSKVPRVYRPYWQWEDWNAGLYKAPWDLTAEVIAARELLSSPQRLENAMRAVVDAWPLAAEHQLSNMEQNRRAWLGWAACKHAAGATAVATRAAWPQLTDDERDIANACAFRVIRDWEEDNGDSQGSLFNKDGGTWDA